MTGQELIDWIKEHNAEDKELLVYYDGYTGDVYCIDCGHLIEQGQVIPATGGGGGEEPGGEG